MFDLAFIIVAQLIKPQAIEIGVDQARQLGFKNRKLSGIQQTLEDRILDALGYAPQVFPHLRSIQQTLEDRILDALAVADAFSGDLP